MRLGVSGICRLSPIDASRNAYPNEKIYIFAEAIFMCGASTLVGSSGPECGTFHDRSLTAQSRVVPAGLQTPVSAGY